MPEPSVSVAAALATCGQIRLKGVPKARTARVPGLDLPGQGVPSARTLLPDSFDLVRDFRNRRLGRKENQAAEHGLDPSIGIDGEN
jgi:hypothetical protein